MLIKSHICEMCINRALIMSVTVYGMCYFAHSLSMISEVAP